MTISPVYSTMDSESNKSPIRLTTTNSSTGGTSSLSGESIENGSILHLRLSFSSNGIQLLPPYLERPLNLSSENSDYSLPDIQSFLSVLSNLSTPVRSSSISQSLPSFNHLPPSTTNNTSSTSSTSSSHLNGHTPLSTSISSSSSSSSSSSTSPSLISEKKRPSHLRSSSLSLERIPEPSSPLKKHREVSPSTLENTLSSCHRAKRIRSASSHQLETSKKKEMEEKSSRKEEKQVGITYMNLPFHAKKDELKAFFESCGPVKQYQFMLGNNRSFRGIAHVTYETPESATKALKLNNTVFRGREVSVCYTDFSLLPRNPHSQSKELPSLLNSRSKRSRSDHYYSSTTATRSASQKASTVLLENLPMGLTLDQIHDEACKNGNVVKVDWANRSKTSSFLEFSRQESAKAAIKRLNAREVNGTMLKATLYDSQTNRDFKTTTERKQPFILKISELPHSVTEAQLRDLLSDVGNIEKLRISKSKHAAYLETRQDEVASAILSKNGQRFLDSTIMVAPYHSRDQ